MNCKEKRSGPAVSAVGGSNSKNNKRRRGPSTDITVKTVTCCAKGKCGNHTEANLVDLVDQEIDKGSLRKSREKKNDSGWENVAVNCWGCGKEF